MVVQTELGVKLYEHKNNLITKQPNAGLSDDHDSNSKIPPLV